LERGLKPLPNELLVIIIKINLTTNYQLLLNCNKVHRAVHACLPASRHHCVRFSQKKRITGEFTHAHIWDVMTRLGYLISLWIPSRGRGGRMKQTRWRKMRKDLASTSLYLLPTMPISGRRGAGGFIINHTKVPLADQYTFDTFRIIPLVSNQDGAQI
jgi:hypothetical protein